MSSRYRVALSGDFLKADGSPVFPDFDLEPLRRAPGAEVAYLASIGPVRAEQLTDFDALILLTQRFTQDSIPANGRLAVVARFGVGYDTVDVDACTSAGIALVITPDGVRRPVAVSIITLMLALTGKLMIKDALTREGPPGFARRGEHMGLGLLAGFSARWASATSAPSCFVSRGRSTCASSPTIRMLMRRSQESWASSLSRSRRSSGVPTSSASTARSHRKRVISSTPKASP
jgi:lactate dehydrogenase-like 2-hydroxyacid dehydrogenase